MKLPQIYRGESIGLHLSANFPLQDWRFRIELFTSYLAYKVVCEYPVQNDNVLTAIIEHNVLKINIPAASCSKLSEGIVLLRIEMSSGDVVRIGTFRIAELLSVNTPSANQNMPIEHQLCIIENDLSLELQLGSNIALNGISPIIDIIQNEDDIKLEITDAEGTKITPSLRGKKGAPGPGVASGGSAGQALVKSSASDYDTRWAEVLRADCPQHLTMPQQAQALSNAGLPAFIIAYDELGGKRVLTADEHALLLSSVLLKVLGTPFGDMCLVYGGHISPSRYRRYTAAMDNMSVLWVEYDIERRVFNPFLQRYFRDLTAITTTRQTWNALQQTLARENTSSVGYLQLAATLGTEAENWPLMLTSPLAEVQAAYTQFWAAPGRYRWSLTINSRTEGNPFVEEAELEPLHRDDGGLELLVTSKRSRKRYALVLTIADGAVTSVGVEFRMRPELAGCLRAGAAFNTQTGFWEYCGLLDLTDQQVGEMYDKWIPSGPLAWAYFEDKTLRATFPPIAHGYNPRCDVYYAFTRSNVEIACLPENIATTNHCFYECRKLKEVHGKTVQAGVRTDYIDAISVLSGVGRYMFYKCENLEWVKLRNVKVDFDFGHCPKLRIECFQYMIQNAASTAAITITVHPDVYARLLDPTQAEWYALNEQAAARNIAFATV